MKHIVYHGYVITVTANNDKSFWRARAIIIWDKGKFELHGEVGFPTEMEAEENGLELGKHWVNNHLQSMQG
ncbi:MAG TPA: hypothetical protein VEG60_33460 [Candidatus Binatia bacterium]|nr:hypothetical protein [Candidatus Binatia bacterium]